MKSNKRLIFHVAAFGALAAAAAALAEAAPCSSAFVAGDVFASVSNSTVNVYTPAGSLVCTLNDGSGATFTTGSAFDAAGNLLVTNFASGTVSRFSNSGALLSSSFISSDNTPESVVNVATGPFAGSTFIGGPGAATINQYNTATGALIHSFPVAGGNGTGGTDWLDFISPTTVIYDGEGSAIKEYDLATSTQLPDFASDPNYGFAMRVIPDGAFTGDVLRADSTQATLLSSTGAILKSYSLPGNGDEDFSINLDPDGTDFWTGDAATGTIWEVNIATGAIDEQFDTCGSECLFGVSVFGEITSSGGGGPPPPPVPEPGTVALLGCGLGLLAMMRRRGRETGH